MHPCVCLRANALSTAIHDDNTITGPKRDAVAPVPLLRSRRTFPGSSMNTRCLPVCPACLCIHPCMSLKRSKVARSRTRQRMPRPADWHTNKMHECRAGTPSWSPSTSPALLCGRCSTVRGRMHVYNRTHVARPSLVGREGEESLQRGAMYVRILYKSPHHYTTRYHPPQRRPSVIPRAQGRGTAPLRIPGVPLPGAL